MQGLCKPLDPNKAIGKPYATKQRPYGKTDPLAAI
jgi:hypothetical protein